jgi:hypothetical protein
MAAVKHTDLSNVVPGGGADLLVDRQRVTVRLGGLGLRARLGVERTTSGASEATTTVAVLTSGAVPAATIALVGVWAGAPGGLVVTLATVVSLVHLGVGVLLVERHRGRGPRPPDAGVDRRDEGTVAPDERRHRSPDGRLPEPDGRRGIGLGERGPRKPDGRAPVKRKRDSRR